MNEQKLSSQFVLVELSVCVHGELIIRRRIILVNYDSDQRAALQYVSGSLPMTPW
jgi:hypothetical protein